jgi:hypothetical protein
VGGFVVGGGYSGATEELDALVVKAAEILEREFGRDVEIRFNSDRRQGGAWLKDDLPRFEGSCSVGINAGYRGGQKLQISAFLAAEVLLDPTMANSGTPERRYSYADHETVEAALAWVTAHVDRLKIPKRQ